MELQRRPLARLEIDYELLGLLLSLGGAVILLVWLSAHLPVPRCVFHDLTSLPCPTCGATRAAWQFLHGNFAASLRFNPLAFFVYGAIGLFDIYAVLVLLCAVPRIRCHNFTAAEKLLVRVVTVSLLLGNWSYLLLARPF